MVVVVVVVVVEVVEVVVGGGGWWWWWWWRGKGGGSWEHGHRSSSAAKSGATAPTLLQLGGASGGQHQGARVRVRIRGGHQGVATTGANTAAHAEQVQADDNQADDDRLGHVPARFCKRVEYITMESSGACTY